MRYRTPFQIASRDHQLATLTAQARTLMKMDRQFRQLLPPAVAGGCRAVRIEDGELLLFADNGLIAARLRLLAPDLLPRIAKLGYPATRVKVRVSPRVPMLKREKQYQISEQALDGIEAAAGEVRHPLVAEALAKLIAHHRR